MDHEEADDGAQEDVAAEDPGRGDGHQNGQADEGGVGDHVQELIPGGAFKGPNEFACEGVGVADGLAEGLHETHHQAGGHDGGEDGDEDVAGGLQDLLPPGHLGGGGLLELRLGGGGQAGDGQEFVIDLVDGAGADDQLELTVGFEHALDAVNLLQSGLVQLAVVSNDQAEAGGTVGRADDIILAAEVGKDLFRALAIVECHDILSFSLFFQPGLKITLLCLCRDKNCLSADEGS